MLPLVILFFMRKIMIFGIVVLSIILIWSLGSKLYVSELESPSYTVVLKQNGYQVREYDPYIEARVVVADGENALNQGFSKVGNYIFGGNTGKDGSESIAMTTPVLDRSVAIAMTTPVLDASEGGSRVISFVMPKEWTLETLPTPNNSEVELREVAGHFIAAISYKEVYRGQRQNKVRDDFLAQLKKDGIEVSGEPTFAYFDPPMTPFFVRRNEIQVPIVFTPESN